jgi:hypothetical protein
MRPISNSHEGTHEVSESVTSPCLQMCGEEWHLYTGDKKRYPDVFLGRGAVNQTFYRKSLVL